MITRLHLKKTQHHVHNCLKLSSCHGSKWCISTYTSTFNNNIGDVLQRVGHLLHNWTLFTTLLVNSLEKVDTSCQAFSLIHCQSCPRQWWAFNLHWVNIHRGLTLGVNKFFTISEISRPFNAFLWYLTTWGPCIFSFLQLCLQTWSPWKQYLANISCEWLLTRGIPICVQPIVTDQYGYRQLRLSQLCKVN